MRQVATNKKIAMHFKGYDELVSRVMDWQASAIRYRKIIFTPFLNEYERKIVYTLANDLFITESGINENCELRRIALSCYEDDSIFPITCLHAQFDKKYHQLTHRHILGALMSLGVERKMVGDIIIEQGSIHLFVGNEIKDFVIQNFKKAKQCNLVFKESDASVIRKEHLSYEKKVISSLRLDAVIASICNISREKAKQSIKTGNIKVNHVVLEECDYLCHNNSTISIRKYGRFLLGTLDQRTKKGRHLIEIGKFI